MITDPDSEGIRLWSEPMDVTLGDDGKWHGANAHALNEVLGFAGGFAWPRRLTDISLTDAVIEARDFDYLLGRSAPPHALPQLRERLWPVAGRQAHVPPTLPFRIVAKPGARLVANYCREIT